MLNQLRNVIILLIATILSGTAIFQAFYSSAYDTRFSGELIDSIFATIALLLAIEIYDFPHQGTVIIKLMWLIFPFFGLILIGIGIIEFGMVAFTFRYRIKAWNEWLAKTMNEHTILIGLGNVGTRILHELLENEIPTTVIIREDEKRPEFVQEMLENPNVAIIFGDAAQIPVLEESNVTKARALLVVTNDDLVNFKIATKAKQLNPDLRTVIRAFDQDFSQKVTELFDIDAAISTSAIAAPAFVATSYEDGIIQTLKSKKGEKVFHLIALSLKDSFSPVNVESFEEEFSITILAIDKLAHPDSDDKIQPGSKLLILGELESVKRIKNQYCV